MLRATKSIALISLLLIGSHTYSANIEPRALLKKAMDNWRGTTSIGDITMHIKRPDWQRSMRMKVWTAGDDTSLVQVIAPAKDAGNASLIKDKDMWSYAPKINRVLKLPSSMMEQSWMGSDFSNKDVSRSTDILKFYDLRLTATTAQASHTIYTIEATPHDSAPVVWGKEVLEIRDDYVLMAQSFYDQDMQLVKVMKTLEVANMGGRSFSKIMRMQKTEKPNEWTQMTTNSIEFDADIPANIFTLSNLRNPRQ